MSKFLDRKERAALEAVRLKGRESVRFKDMPVGVGKAAVESLVSRGLLETVPGPHGRGGQCYRVTRDGWRCMFGKTYEQLRALPAAKPLGTWFWPRSGD